MVWSLLQEKFLNPLLRLWTSYSAKTELASIPTHDEDFTRFIFSKSHYSSEKKRVKPPALLPLFNERKQRWETSIFRVRGLRTNGIWKLGYLFTEGNLAERKIKARGSGCLSCVAEQQLGLDVNADPYPRHVDITGWADVKHERLHKATEIANQLNLDLDPRSGD